MAKAGQSAQSQWAAAGFALPEYHFELIFKGSRRNPEGAKTRKLFGCRGVDLHELDLIAGERWLRQHLGNGGQCIP
jgi:hypothetical protein